jgi:hypothetical protein
MIETECNRIDCLVIDLILRKLQDMTNGLLSLAKCNLVADNLDELELLIKDDNYCDKITVLDLSDNCIMKVEDLTYLINLEKLILSSNQLADFNFAVLPSTCKFVNLSNNDLRDGDIICENVNSTIVSLYLEGNKISDFNFNIFTKLEFLDLSKNNIRTLKELKMKSLLTLKCRYCPELTHFEDSNLVSLVELDLKDCSLTHIMLVNKYLLVNISHNLLSNSIIMGRAIIDTLNISHNKIRVIESRLSHQIRCLNISHNELTQLTPPNFAEVVIASHNNITSSNFYMSNKIKYADISHNNLMAIPFLNSLLEKNSVTLNISHNKITQTDTYHVSVLEKIKDRGLKMNNCGVKSIHPNTVSLLTIKSDSLDYIGLSKNEIASADCVGPKPEISKPITPYASYQGGTYGGAYNGVYGGVYGTYNNHNDTDVNYIPTTGIIRL